MFSLNEKFLDPKKKVISGHDHNIPCVSVSPDDRFILSVSIDGTGKIWDIDSGKELASTALNQWGWGCLWIDASTIKDILEPDLVTALLLNTLPNDPSYIHESDTMESTQIDQMETEEIIEEDNANQVIINPTPIRQFKNTEAVPQVPENYFILCSTFHDLYIYDSNFVLQSSFLQFFKSISHLNLQIIERLSLLFYIPELSVIVAASQGCCAVIIARIFRDLSTMTYAIEPEIKLPYNTKEFSVSGLTYYKFSKVINGKTVPIWRILILFHDSSLMYYDICSADNFFYSFISH